MDNPNKKVHRVTKLFTIIDEKLPNKTIVLPKIIYSEIKNKETALIIRYPMLEYSVIKLSDIDVLLSDNETCSISIDLAMSVFLDFGGDVLCIYDIQ